MFRRILQKLEGRVTRIMDQDDMPSGFGLAQILAGASLLYGKGVDARLALYRSGRKRSCQLPCPVVSIGNITAGGAGKTPMAVFLAERFMALGKRAVVISRGYKGDLKQGAAVVGDGKKIFLGPDQAGDEPYMMACRKTFPVVIGKKRVAAGQLAIDRFAPDILILDDGFQHLALSRDLDIVLMDHDRPLGNGRMLPAGRLRETPDMCRERMGCIVLTRCPAKPSAMCINPQVFGNLPVFHSRHVPYVAGWKTAGPGGSLNAPKPHASALQSPVAARQALLFSGIAGNNRFRETAEGMGVTVLDHLEFQDHYRYKRADFEKIRERAVSLGAQIILTTEKDWVKVDRAFDFPLDLCVIGIRMAFEEEEAFDRFLNLRVLARI